MLSEQTLNDLKFLVDELNKKKSDVEKIKSLMKKVDIKFSNDSIVCLQRVMEKISELKTQRAPNDLR